MPSLTRLHTWHRWEPAIGENLDLPPERRFWLEVAVGLTVAERDGIAAQVDAADKSEPEWKRWADALSPWVRFGKEPLTVNGKPVATLAELLDLAGGQLGAGATLAMDVLGAVLWFNSFKGGREVFSERLSGGSTGTRSQ